MALLELSAVGKRFRGQVALAGVDLTLEPGEVLAVVGENGAGKSTLAKVASGVFAHDEGRILVDGQPVRFSSPMEALARGIAAVHQGPHLLPQLSVAENLLVGREPRTRLGFVSASLARDEAERLVKEWALGVDLDARLAELSETESRKVEIVRVLGRGARVLVLDEPVEGLGAADRTWFADVADRLRREGVALLLVSHRLPEVIALADRVAVLRRGAVVARHDARGLDPAALVDEMAPGGAPAPSAARAPRTPGPERLAVEGAGVSGVQGVSFAVGEGEVLGLAGEPGDARGALLEALVGRGHERLRGTVRVSGEARTIRSPLDAIRHGLGLVTLRRRVRGLALEMSLDRPSFFSEMGGVAARWFVGTRERDHDGGIDLYVKDLGAASVTSGELWKWLHDGARAVLFHEPFRGAGPAARRALAALFDELAARGCAVVVASSELSELRAAADRVLTLEGGSFRPLGGA